MYPTSDPFLGCHMNINEEGSIVYEDVDGSSSLFEGGEGELVDIASLSADPAKSLVLSDNSVHSSGEDSNGPGDIGCHHEADVMQIYMRIQTLETVVAGLLKALPQSLINPKPVEIKKSQLDRLCVQVFEQAPEPTPIQLAGLVNRIEEQFPGYDRRQLLSVARRWFRKRREDVGLRLLASIKRKHQNLKKDKADILKSLEDGSFDMTELVNEARLAMCTTEAISKFSKLKLITYLQRL